MSQTNNLSFNQKEKGIDEILVAIPKFVSFFKSIKKAKADGKFSGSEKIDLLWQTVKITFTVNWSELVEELKDLDESEKETLVEFIEQEVSEILGQGATKNEIVNSARSIYHGIISQAYAESANLDAEDFSVRKSTENFS